ncbi:MAG: helix-turn-helix transcriptional regulator [Bacteroidales bacterium]|nr:helix-turn-helix transcriptional regulator [Bacteroidales bacterium]
MKKVTNAEREANLNRVAPLIQYLKDNHISQSEVAQRSGLALGTINRILHGWQVLMPNTLQRIADALEVEYYILNGEDTVQRAFNLEEVCGFLEYKGVITKVSSVYDVKCWLKSIEGEVSEPDDEQVVIKSKLNK